MDGSWKGILTGKIRKKIIDQIFSYINFYFEISAHLGHLFTTPKIINRSSCAKNVPGTKLNHVFIV